MWPGAGRVVRCRVRVRVLVFLPVVCGGCGGFAGVGGGVYCLLSCLHRVEPLSVGGLGSHCVGGPNPGCFPCGYCRRFLLVLFVGGWGLWVLWSDGPHGVWIGQNEFL